MIKRTLGFVATVCCRPITPFLPVRDGSPLGFLKTVIMADGRLIRISAGNPND